MLESEGCKKGGGGALCNFANRQFIHSNRASEIRTKHKGGGGRGGGEIQQQQKLSTLCNNLTHKNALKPPRRHQQSLLICQEGTGSFSPPFFQFKTRATESLQRQQLCAFCHFMQSNLLQTQQLSSPLTSGKCTLLLPLPRPDPPLTSHDQSTTAPFLFRHLSCIRH